MLVSSSLSSCYTMVKVPEKIDYTEYIGYSENQIVSLFGEQKMKVSDTEDSQIMLYEKIKFDERSKQELKQFTQFFINKSGIVYKWNSNETIEVDKKKFSAGKLVGLLLIIDGVAGAAILLSSEAYLYW